MEPTQTLLATLQSRWGEPWLITPGADQFWSQLQQFQRQFQAEQPRDVLIVDPEPNRFLAAFLAAVQQPARVWLGDARWGTREWSQVGTQCRPDIIIGAAPAIKSTAQFPPPRSCTPQSLLTAHLLPIPTLHIPTGGSSGNIRFAIHTWDTLAASVQGFCQHFDCDAVNAYCVLPLYHVSGLMQALRSLLTGGQLVHQPFSELLNGGPSARLSSTAADHAAGQFLSLVPTQLQRLLKADWDAISWLRQFTAVLLGGAPPWPSLLQNSREYGLPLAPTYGMTETASQVATLLPSEFLAGQTGSGRALPHARLTIRNGENIPLAANQVGEIVIAAKSLALASGTNAIAPPLRTGDLGYFDQNGFLHVLGRERSLIITGGEKVSPEEVEAALLATGLVQDAAVFGVPDSEWGERVVAVVVSSPAKAEDFSAAKLRQALKPQLSAYKIPKQWWQRTALPRNAQGKLNRTVLRQWVVAQSNPSAEATELVPLSKHAAGD